jgi:hypothetical protein
LTDQYGTGEGAVSSLDWRSPAVWLLLAAGAVFYLANGFTEMAGSDMWWHIAAGRELFQTGTLWMVDDWSFTAHGRDWLNHEWLSDIVYYAWVKLLGVQSLVYWKWAVIVATFLILQLVLARQTGDHLAALLCSAVAVAIAAPFLDVRPHLYTLLNFSLLLLLTLGRQTGPLALGLLFLVWVNLHGGFFFGLMAAAILVFPWRRFSLRALRGAVITGLVCLAAATLNPSGLETFLYPLKYAFDQTSPFRQLGEWLPPWVPGGITSPLFSVFMWAPLLGLAYLVPSVRKSAGLPIEGILLTILTLAMALTSRRFIPLFGMSLAVMLAPLVALCFERLQLRRFGIPLGLAALAFAGYRLSPYPLASGPAFHYLTAEYSYPVDMLNYIEANDIGGNVYALYNWGGYIHWRVDGRLKVFIDGRADTIYDDATYYHYIQVLGSRPNWLQLVENSDADYILWPHLRKHGQAKLKELLATGRWRPVYRDSVSWLLARNEADLPDELLRSPATPWRDLAVARVSYWADQKDTAVEYAEKTRQQIPWQRDACNLLVELYRQRGDEKRSAEVSRQCRAYFPSDLLLQPDAR